MTTPPRKAHLTLAARLGDDRRALLPAVVAAPARYPTLAEVRGTAATRSLVVGIAMSWWGPALVGVGVAATPTAVEAQNRDSTDPHAHERRQPTQAELEARRRRDAERRARAHPRPNPDHRATGGVPPRVSHDDSPFE